jgi:hypothetical protein
MMSEAPIWQFINELSSDAPIPGGGGASGLVAACGMALGNMVLSLTTGKKKFEQYQDEIDELIEKGNNLTDALLRGMDADAAAFIPLTMAYRMPKDTEEEQAKRDAMLAFKTEVQAEYEKILTAKIQDSLQGEALGKLIRAALEGEDISGYTAEVAEVSDALKAELAQEIRDGLTICPTKGVHAGFRLAAKDGSGYFDCTDEEIMQMLMPYFRNLAF